MELIPITKSVLYSALIVAATSANADTINLTIEGEGKVQASEANIECTESCTIENNLSVNTLIPEPVDSWIFSGWRGQQCDAGKGVLINSELTDIAYVDGGAKTLAAADINGDGIDDLAMISLFNGQLTTLTNDGAGSFARDVISDELVYPAAMAFYDWDGDGDQDLVVADYGDREVKLFANDGNGGFTFNSNIDVPNNSVYAIAIADLNDDQQPDLIVSSFAADTSGNLATLVESISSAAIATYLNDNGSFSLGTVLSETASITLDVKPGQQENTFTIASAEIAEGPARCIPIPSWKRFT